MLELNCFCFNMLISFSSSSTISNTRAGLKNFLSGMNTVEPTKSEIEEYLFAPLDEASVDAQFDILSWWKLKALKYPILARLTRDILVVLILTVASESAFSTAGRTLSPVRSSLNDESIEDLICVQYWLRASVRGPFSL
jgi:hAT family C-terminal dimerisation region